MGLREKIQKAKSQDEITSLLNTGYKEYEYASKQTINSWKNTATKRLKELVNVDSSPKQKQSKQKQSVKYNKRTKKVKKK